MQYSALITAVSKRTNLVAADVRFVLDSLITETTKALVEGEEVNLAGFGKLKPKIRPARKARNPRTGEQLFLPERRKIEFVPAKGFDTELN